MRNALHVIGGIDMSDSVRNPEWFLGGILVLALLQYAFSGSGGTLLVSVLRVGRLVWVLVPTTVFAWAWLTLGLLVALVVFAIAVGLLGAPARLWYVALALSLLRLGALLAAIAPFLLLGAGAVLASPGVWAGIVNAPYGSGAHLAVAIVGYVLVAMAGCGLGALIRRRPDSTASHA